jgi:hypothetical protein
LKNDELGLVKIKEHGTKGTGQARSGKNGAGQGCPGLEMTKERFIPR